ncbi:MAG: hypothetical protein AB8B80_00275 [Marinicellaceae bacterium]
MKIIILIFLILTSIAVNSGVPSKINYVGTRADGGGGLINDTLNIQFSLYDTETAGVALWTETQTVEIVEGSFSVQLGEINPMSFELFSTNVYLGMNVNNDGEMSPRQPFNTVPYSFKAETIFDQVLVVRGSDTSMINGQNLVNLMVLTQSATSEKPILVYLEPGVFDIGNQSLELNEYVHLKGFGRELTRITSSAQHSIIMANHSGVSQMTVINTGSGLSQDFSQPSSSAYVNLKNHVSFSNVFFENSEGSIKDGIRTGIFSINSSMEMLEVKMMVDGGLTAYGLRASSDGSNTMPDDVDAQLSITNSEVYVSGATESCRGLDLVGVVADINNIKSQVNCDVNNNIGFRLQAWSRGVVDGLDVKVSGLTSGISIGAQFYNVNTTSLNNYELEVTGSTSVNDGLWYGVEEDFTTNTLIARNGNIKVYGEANYQFGVELWSARPILSQLYIDVKGLDANTKSRGISFGYDFNDPLIPQISVMQLSAANINVNGINNESFAIAGTDFQIEIDNSTFTTSNKNIVFWPSNFAADSEVIISNSSLKSTIGESAVDLFGGDGMGALNAIILNSHLSGNVQLGGGTVLPTATCAGNTTGTYQFLTNTCP